LVLSVGDRGLGNQVINYFLQEEHEWIARELEERRYLATEQHFSICVIKWLLAIARHVYERQMIQSNLTESLCHLEPHVSGECWRDAFGDILEADLSQTFRALKSSPTWAAQQNLFSSFFSDSSERLVTCELEELLLAMGASSRIVIDEILLVQGECGLAA
jgi:hypothetical protein